MTIKGTVWTPIGPSPMALSGRQDNGLTSAIAINPNNPNIIYQGTAGGGVWRTDDGGVTWMPLFDRQISLGIGEPSAIAIDPNDTNTIYVGTSTRLTPQATAGLFRSTDSGASWVRLGSGYPAGNTGNATQFLNRNINVVIVDPANSQNLYLASDRGVFFSTDGGLNWSRGAGINNNGDVRSLVLDTSSPAGARVLYAGVTNSGIVNGGVFQSTNGGQNWVQILGPTTPAVAAAVGAPPRSFTKVLVEIAPPTSPPNPNGVQVIYASMTGFTPQQTPPLTPPAPDPVGLFISTDQGGTWTQQGGVGIPTNTQGGYSFYMAVDPASPGDGVNDIIYLGDVRHGRSTDSGANFTILSGLHADNHAWAFAPQADGTSAVFCGNDGGIFRSTDGGTTWNSLNAGGLQTGLFYNIAVRPDAAASVTLGTMQDNGAQTTSGAAAPGWNSPQGGDGWDVVYDGVTAGRAYATSGFWAAQDPSGNVQACTRVFVSTADGTDLPPTVPIVGQSFPDVTPWFGAATDQGCYLASIATDPSTAGVVYVAGNQNLWQSRNGGVSWNNLGAFPTGFKITARVSVAPSNGNNIVVAAGTQVSVSTNALGPVAGVTFTNITRNLPNRQVLRVAFDPNDPTVIYAVLGGFNGAGAGQSGHVFRTTIGGTAWTDISPDLDVPFGALALDGTDTPTTIYVGTDLGVLRSVDQGMTWYVLDDIHFPRAPVTDLEIGRGSGILRAATYGRGIFEFSQSDGPAITVNLEDHFDFGTVCEGPKHLTLQIFNVGGADLMIHSVQRLMGSTAFEVDPFPATPLVIAAGEEVDFSVHFTPTTPGVDEMATIRITSNDPGAPQVDLLATGVGGIATAEVAIADAGDFGEVCLGSFVDRDLVINNTGDCPLEISAINSSSPAFVVPGVMAFPLVVSPGASITLPLRFQPTALGAASATIDVVSNDPSSPAQVPVEGTTPAPRLVIIVPDAGDFGKSCLGEFVDRPLTLSNSGGCDLVISDISSSSGDFIVANVDTYPLMIAPGDEIIIMIRFQPTALGDRSGTITIESNDPASPHFVDVSGFVGAGKLVVTGSSHFGEVEYGTRALQHLTLLNVGDCNLTIRSAKLKKDELGRCSNLCLLKTPFPVTLPPGASIDIVLQFHATCDCPCRRKLIIKSDDPDNPKRRIIVSGRTRPTLKAALYCWLAESVHSLLDTAAHVPAMPTDDCADEE